MTAPPQQPIEPSGETPRPLFSLTVSPLTVLIPVLDDWTAAGLLLRQLDEVFAKEGISARVLLVDDGSTEPPPEGLLQAEPKSLRTVDLLELKKNLGHQRALCVGLVYLEQEGLKGPVLIMDADGEDAPADVPRLLREFERQGSEKIVFAARGRRTEGILFKFFYLLYRSAHRALVGFDVRIGNFSIVPAKLVGRLVVSSDLWNHYAAAAVKARLPRATVTVDRAKRFSGKSKMGFVGLVAHGLSAMSVFGDVVGVRFLLAFAALGAIAVGLLGAAVALHFLTALTIPGWTTYVAGMLLLLLFLLFLLSLIFTFVILYSRGQSSFVPARDSLIYKGSVRRLFPRHA